MKKALAILLLCVGVFSCDEDVFPYHSTDYLIFGSFGNECSGDCMTAYRVTDLKVEEDDWTQRFSNDYQFIPTRLLDSDALQRAQELMENLPADLINNDEERYGCPDCADQGAVFLTFHQRGEQRTIVLDNRDTDDMSAAIVAYKDSLWDFFFDFRE